MPRLPELYLQDILDAISQIEHYTSFFSFGPKRMRSDAIIRNLEIIGEAVKHLPLEITTKYPLEWRKMAGLRDILTHAYFGVDKKIIDDIIKNKLPELKETVTRILKK